ncbi:transcriptional regulator [Acinetobacter dispersus]|uniref:transcriptional regulator n=1 Tax=Acinetobacter dispersus TaxID=70348 RepID=UPI001F4AF388|nr:transcriptional regulator [Acinetobacter dispersus]MCH7391819.1 transcriptional regulator [Acinetobacter dispersus]
MSKRLNQTDSLDGGDQFVIYKGNCTDFRALPQDVFLEWIKENFPDTPSSSNPVVQHFNPNGNFSLTVENHSEGTYLLLNPVTSITNGSLVLPLDSDVLDQQPILFSCSQQITNLSINGSGAIVVGAPNAIAANAFFKLQYDKLSGTWYRVG